MKTLKVTKNLGDLDIDGEYMTCVLSEDESGGKFVVAGSTCNAGVIPYIAVAVEFSIQDAIQNVIYSLMGDESIETLKDFKLSQ